MMITSEDQLTEGRELWYLYGHLSRRAEKVQVMGGLKTGIFSDSTIYRYVEMLYDKDGPYRHLGRCHLTDVGIGASYNMNRLFDSEQEALEFWDSTECEEYRKRESQRDWSVLSIWSILRGD